MRFFKCKYEFTTIQDVHIGLVYEELEMDKERYLSKGLIWKQKTYGFRSPKLSKMDTLCKKGLIRHLK